MTMKERLRIHREMEQKNLERIKAHIEARKRSA